MAENNQPSSSWQSSLKSFVAQFDHSMKEAEKSLDPQLWHACAGGMVQMPPMNSKVFYFPQGHAEHAQCSVDFAASLMIPPLILCRVAAVKFLADPETDEVFVKMRLVPLRNSQLDGEDGDALEGSEKQASLAKTLIQSVANVICDLNKK